MLRARGFLALLVALAGSSAGCTIVIGERPEDTESGPDADVDGDATGSGERDGGQDERDADVTPEADASGGNDAAGERDAGAGDASSFDAGATDGGDEDAGADAAMDAGADAASHDATSDDTGTEPDTGTSDSGPDCTTPVTWYLDGDGDGYGGEGETRQACAKPAGKWSRTNDDCHDDNVKVHPGQTEYFETAYIKLTGGDSFDYDCSTAEDGKPGQSSLEGGCMSLLGLGLSCNEISGYMPRQDRTGAGRNAMCGSPILARCSGTILSCNPGSPELAPSPYSCR